MTHIVIQEAHDGKVVDWMEKASDQQIPQVTKESMELIFALIARRGRYKQSDSIVPEPAEFLPFDLRALERSYWSEQTASHSETRIRNELIF